MTTNSVKTNYTKDLNELIQATYDPATPEEPDIFKFSLSEIHTQVIKILPEQWVNESDIYVSLQKLGFKPHNVKFENKEMINKKEVVTTTYQLLYIVKMK